MSKNFVTVCVFCLLCATHTPCSSHVQFASTETNIANGPSPTELGDILPVKKAVFGQITDGYSPTVSAYDEKLAESLNNENNRDNKLSFNTKVEVNNKTRTKRDVHRNKNKVDDNMYIEKIFNLFGNGETINQKGFERLVKSLHLDRLLWSKLNNNSNNDANLSPPTKVAANGIVNDTNTTCMDHKDLLKSVSSKELSHTSLNVNSTEVELNSLSFRRLCPVLLYQIVAPSSAERQGCIKMSNNEVDNAYDETVQASSQWPGSNNMGSVWLYSTLSIIIISACGLLGVLVIPIMQQHYYQHLIQFLVALAVGTLSGDALLHLLPHAMMNHSHDSTTSADGHDHNSEADAQDPHEKNMWRGFVAMLGLIFFFFMEKCLTLGAEWRKQRQLRKNKLPARVRVMREQDTASTTSVGCKHKYSSYPYCYGVIATETQDDHHNHPHNHLNNVNQGSHNNTTSTILNELDSESEFLTKNPNTHSHLETNQNMSKCTNNSKSMKCSESNKMLAENADSHTLQDFAPAKNEISESESYTVILRTHETKHHGHSHTHGHVHSAPKTMSSVAWMVIMGDGLHNFTDGMAIGAAFAGSLAGGFSTAVAVFCHELPHEIGDFAVLLKAGMTARQAVFYNMLSSVLCLFGMVLGVIVGNNDNASSWLFACAAGMFLYIALVDMIPELTTSHSKEGGSFLQCVLQFFGLLCGLGIMLVIALYENDLKRLFHD